MAGGQQRDDLVWVYDDPKPEVQGIAGLLAFYGERVELEVDGRHDMPFDRVS